MEGMSLRAPHRQQILILFYTSSSDFQVEHAVREIKRLLIEASAAALQAEMRNPTATSGRYSVV